MNILLVLNVVVIFVGGFHYCSKSCKGTKHTVCQYRSGGDTSCRGYNSGLTKDEKAMILSLHNQLRQKVSRGSQPPAADMMELTWDEEVAMIAQRWANQCNIQAHDRCRICRDGASVGQNIAYGWVEGGYINRSAKISDWLNSWYEEVRAFSSSNINRFQTGGNFRRIGHYSQLVWATTTRVGCGLVDSTNGHGVYRYKFVCDYKPAGNTATLSVYKQGRPCSACPSGTRCSHRYPGLCATT